MKTIIHLTLSDLERGHLATVWFDRKSLVSRGEVTEFVNASVKNELALRGRNDGQANELHNDDGSGVGQAGEGEEPVPVSGPDAEGHGSERSGDGDSEQSYLALPTAARLSAACRRVQDHIALNKDDDCVNIGWCVSILAAEGVG